MKLSKLSLIICCLIIIAGCNKNNEYYTTVNGKVLEFGTNIPIEGAKVFLYGGIPDGDLSNPGAILEKIDSFITNPDGSYSFAFDAKSYPIREMSVKEDLYFPIKIGDVILRIYTGKDNEIDIIMNPHAWLNIYIKNTIPYDEFDRLGVWGSWGGGNVFEVFGENVEDSKTILVKGNKELTIFWSVTKNGIKTSYQEPVICPAHDTTSFEILY